MTERYPCPYKDCRYSTEDAALLATHCIAEHPEEDIDITEDVTTDDTSTSPSNDTEEYTCYYQCGFKANNDEELEGHYFNGHTDRTGKVRTRKCLHCTPEIEFRDVTGEKLRKHMREVHPDITEEPYVSWPTVQADQEYQDFVEVHKAEVDSIQDSG